MEGAACDVSVHCPLHAVIGRVCWVPGTCDSQLLLVTTWLEECRVEAADHAADVTVIV